jgi:hypothetical protein
MAKLSERRTTEVCERGGTSLLVVRKPTNNFDKTRTFQIILNIIGKQQSLGTQWKNTGKRMVLAVTSKTM